jgi:hypothetical protein
VFNSQDLVDGVCPSLIQWLLPLSAASINAEVLTPVRCSAIEGILHRYHRCGPIFMLEDKGNYRGSSLRMAFRIFRCHRAPKTNEGSLDTSFGDLKPT